MKPLTTFAVLMICVITVVCAFAFDGFADQHILGYNWGYKSLLYCYIIVVIVAGFHAFHHLALLLSVDTE